MRIEYSNLRNKGEVWKINIVHFVKNQKAK
jgi:hypothetical protein